MAIIMLKMSVIIPVYNSEKYLPLCLDSLVRQTIDKSQLEVLLVDDGSTDRSAQIIDAYAEKYPFFKCYHLVNKGQSSARNYALKRARGTYISFLDSDDAISDNLLEKYVRFFDEHYDETDLVTCRVTRVNEDGTHMALHPRYNTLNETKVYDLNEGDNIYIAHSSMNICIKNRFENNITFDACSWQEDMRLCIEIIKEKQTLGFVSDCDYFYYQHPGSTAGHLHGYYIFELITAFWEKLFAEYPIYVPDFIQGYFLNDFEWKTRGNKLMPYHYSPEKFAEAERRIGALLARLDDDIIRDCPYLSEGRKSFIIHLNHAYDDTYEYDEVPRAVIRKIAVKGNRLTVEGRLNTYLAEKEGFRAYLVCGDQKKELKLSYSNATPRFDSRIAYPHFEFSDTVDIRLSQRVMVVCEYEGYRYTCKLTYSQFCAINNVRNKASIGGCLVSISGDNGFEVRKMPALLRFLSRLAWCVRFALKHPKAFINRQLNYLPMSGPIWLYSDRDGFTDNGYTQFKHDFAKNDGVKRYYVTHSLKNKSKLFTPEELKHTVEWGSRRHYQLYFHAQKLLTAYIEEDVYTPFGKGPMRFYTDLHRPEIIYLQHGVMHADLSHLYSYEVCCADKVVISSDFEKIKLTRKYNYKPEQLLLTGMPSLDLIQKSESERKIIFSPSWRKNLIGQYKNGVRHTADEVFLKSVFYQETQAFLNSPRLARLLRQYDYTLDFKNHPIFEPYNKYISSSCDRVHLVSGSAELAQYALMITDFSSIVFNFVYLGRPIVYFAPDYELFRSGMTHSYKRLDIPLENGFGPMTETADALLDELEALLQNGMKPIEKYRKRGESFFPYRDNHCERLYNALINS